MGRASKNLNQECPRCKSLDIIKSGKPKGIQRYKCKNCNYQFTINKMLKKPGSDKAIALALHSYGASMENISKLLNVSVPCIHYWIMEFKDKNFIDPERADIITIKMDKIWELIPNKFEGKRTIIIPIDENTGRIAGFINYAP